MGEPWLKLYKKIGEHEVLFDNYGLRLFIWLLTHVKSDGTIIVSRFLASQILRLNPSSFRNALTRLEKKYKVVTTKRTTNYTVVTLIHWTKYQTNVS